ncbi:hypothetical protein HanPSC8_Chr09g0394791 [Helianthus annuus]|nr:hypothetical protein HanPSC8_Chr09g0394791 [Helianthus annuus]
MNSVLKSCFDVNGQFGRFFTRHPASFLITSPFTSFLPHRLLWIIQDFHHWFRSQYTHKTRLVPILMMFILDLIWFM